MRINLVPLAKVTPYDRNPRNHDVDAIARSIREFGWQQPIVVDGKGIIIVGHGRYYAAKQLGLEKVPVKEATNLTPAQVRAYRLADNKTNELASWNMELLASELEALKAANYDLGLLGFGQDELAKLMNTGLVDGATDPDAVPDPPDEATTQRGDIWQLGNHRLMCGDSTVAGDVDQLLAGAKIHLVNMDPPYNVKVEPRSNNAIAAGLSSYENPHQGFDLARHPGKGKPTGKMRAKDRPLANDFVSDAEFDRLLDGWFGNASRVLMPGRSYYIWGGYANIANYPRFLQKHRLKFSQQIIWHKQHPVMTRKDFMGDHEWCFYGWKEGAAHVFLGPKNITDVWSIKKVSPNAMVHLTEKPVELAIRAMQYSSRPGENVLDLFGGSGSTTIAAEQAGRRAFSMELDPLYCDVIVKRFEQFTGRKAQLVAGPSLEKKRPAAKPPKASAAKRAAPARRNAKPARGRRLAGVA